MIRGEFFRYISLHNIYYATLKIYYPVSPSHRLNKKKIFFFHLVGVSNCSLLALQSAYEDSCIVFFYHAGKTYFILVYGN